MRLYCDRGLQRFILAPGTTQELTSIRVKRGPATEIEVQFFESGSVTPIELPASASGVFEVKTLDEFDSSPLTAALAWVKTGTGEDTLYTFTLGLINDPLDALLGVDELQTFVTAFGTDLFTATAHGLAANDIVQFSSSVTLPAPLLPNTDYFVIASGLTANDFRVSTMLAGSTINLTNDGTGIHSFRRTTNDENTVTLMAAMEWIADGRTNETQTLDFILENDVVRAGDIPPAFPALVYAVFLPEITSLAGFKAVPTVGMSLGYLVEILVDVSGTFTWLTYRLESGPTSEAEPEHVEPDDYDLGTNNVHWTGAAGPAGPAGVDAGFSYKWNTATSGDPGTGKVLVNAALASATLFNINETDDNGRALAPMLATWDDGTSAIRGRLLIQDMATLTNFAIYDITGTQNDAGAWREFAISHVASGGSFSNGLALRVFFYPKGDAAATPSITQNYSTTTTDADPGSGIFRLSSTTIASVTAAYLDNNDAGGNAITTFLDTLDDSTNTARGTIVFRGITSPLAFAVFAVTGSVVDGTGYRKLTLTHQASGGTWTNGELFAIAFYRAGDAGPGYRATSTTSLLISIASKAFTTQANLAYTVGARVRATSAANTANWMEGLVTAYSSTTLTVLIDKINGSGTLADWNINIGGQPGVDGATVYPASSTIPAGTSGVVIDWSTVTTAVMRTLTGNTTFDFTNLVDGKTIIIPIANTASNFTVGWNDVDFWQGTGGADPVQSLGTVVDLYTFFYNGTYVFGTWAPGA